ALVERLGRRRPVLGPAAALGRGREGTAQVLGAIGAERGFSVDVVAPLGRGGQRIASGGIREGLAAGRLGAANAMLGYSYSLSGVVERGHGVGARLGVPTANLAMDSARCLPAVGVYACRALVDGRNWAAATSVGFRPTFGGTTLTVE